MFLNNQVIVWFGYVRLSCYSTFFECNLNIFLTKSVSNLLWKFTTRFYQSESLKIILKTGPNPNHLFIFYFLKELKCVRLGLVFNIIFK